MAINNVSDTAKWVALYRAMESDRPDALFCDPYARKLAGAEGEAIVNSLKSGPGMAWVMITRTAVFDEIITHAIRHAGMETVINLAAGLDARPWRMDLPATLKWYDVDLPGVMEYKTSVMAGAPTKCQYEAIHADLTDADARGALFRRLGAASTRALIVTEGLLVYLDAEQVGSLAADLSAQPTFHRWLMDLGSPLLLQFLKRQWGNALEHAPFKFGPAAGTDFFTPFGWRELAFRPSIDESRRLGREMKGAWFYRLIARLYPKATREKWRRMSAAVVLQNAVGG